MTKKTTISPVTLRSFSALDDLSDAALEELAKVLIPMSVRCDDIFHQIGNKESYLFLIQSGAISISTEIQGTLKELSILSEYQAFGHSALFRQSSLSLQCKAIEDSTLYVIPRHMHQWALERAENWAIELHRSLSVQLVQQLRYAMDTLKSSIENPPEDKQKLLIEMLQLTDFSIPSDVEPI